MEKDILCAHQSQKSWNGHMKQIKKTSKAGTFNRDKEKYFIFIKGLIHEEDITLLSVYAPYNKISKFMKYETTEQKGNIKRCNYCQKFQYFSVNRTNRKKIIQVIKNLNSFSSIRSTDIWNITLNCRIHVLFQCIWNIHKDGPCAGP